MVASLLVHHLIWFYFEQWNYCNWKRKKQNFFSLLNMNVENYFDSTKERKSVFSVIFSLLYKCKSQNISSNKLATGLPQWKSPNLGRVSNKLNLVLVMVLYLFIVNYKINLCLCLFFFQKKIEGFYSSRIITS